MGSSNDWASLFAAAAAQHGVVTTGCARQHRVSPDALRLRAGREHWRRARLPDGRVLRGAYLLPGARDDHRTRLQAVMLRLGEDAVASHATAAHLHGLRRRTPAIHVTVPVDRRPRSRGGLVVVRAELARVHVTRVDGIATTTPARTARDLASSCTLPELLGLLTDLEQRRLARLDDLVAMGEQAAFGAGAGLFRHAVDLRRRDRVDSTLERDTVRLCQRAGFEPHPGPYRLEQPGRRAIHLDVAFPAIRFAIECDGFAFHRDRREFERDRRRWRTVLDAGWRVTWVTRQRLVEEPDAIIAEVRRAHESIPSTRR